MVNGVIRVNFVCHGNICRSPMAEYVFKKYVNEAGLSEKFFITSSAVSNEEIGNPMHYGTRHILTENGIPFKNHRAVKFSKQDYNRFDYIIAMDKSNIRNIKRIIGSDAQGKVYLFLSFAGENRDIADPWYTGNFNDTYADNYTCIEKAA